MTDYYTPSAATGHAIDHAAERAADCGTGPAAERRSPAPAWPIPAPAESRGPAAVLARMLDEAANGMIALTVGNRVLHANQAARELLNGDFPLELQDGRLRARCSGDASELNTALDHARRGRRRFLMLGTGANGVAVNVVPIESADEPGLVMLTLGRRHVGDRLTLDCFARHHGLTDSETRVLQALCNGIDPVGIAALRGVGIATVRTQISSVRQKTAARDITALVRLVAQLPPMALALRHH